MADKSYLTAISRRTLSKPARWLQDNGRLRGRTLDFGSGRGGDYGRLECEAYDPHHGPEMPVGPFETIMCNYVVNVIRNGGARRDILARISELLSDTGYAYIAVRTKRADLKGTTKRGTWQGLIELDLPIEYKDSDCTIYCMEKGQEACAMRVSIFPEN